MLIREIITEARLGTLQIGGFSIAVSEHILIRVDQRRIPVLEIDRILRRMPELKPEIDSLDENQKFWAYDQSRSISLGMRKFTDNKLLLSTAIYGEPGRSDDVTVLTFKDE